MSGKGGWARMVASTALLLGALGCAMTQPSSDPWTTRYVGSPDDVWSALHIALVDLDYAVDRENRDDGVIHATRDGAGDRPAAVLSIDQIMTGDIVKVYVRVASGADQPTMARNRQDELANEFLAAVNATLYP